MEKARNVIGLIAGVFLPFCAYAQNLSDNGGFEVPPAPASPALVCNIVFVGDSITAGATLSDSAGQSAPVRCVESLRARYAVTIHLSNQGHSGHTTVDWLPSVSPASDFQRALAAAASLQASQPGQLIFSIMLGANDSAEHGPNGAPVFPAAYLQNMQSIVDGFLAHYPDALIFLHYPTWYSTNTQNSSLYGRAGLARLAGYFPELDRLMAGCAITHPGHVFAGDRQAFNYFSANYQTNLTPESGVQGTFYLHPNSAGSLTLGKFWAEAMATALHLPSHRAPIAGTPNRDSNSGASNRIQRTSN